jgi:hypothetical protein
MKKSIILGGAFGAGLFLFQQGWYFATATILFPSLNTPVFQNLQTAIDEKAGPKVPRLGYQPIGQSGLLELATSVLKSRDALKAAGLLKVNVKELGTTRLQICVGSKDPSSGMSGIEKLFLYYREFLQRSALTQTHRARMLIERELGELGPRLSFLESQVRRAREVSNPLGDALVGVDTQVMEEVWSKRVEGSMTSQATSDFFRELLQGSSRPLSNKSLSASLSVRHVQLERTYGDALALRRALLNEYSQMRLLERLDSPEFEILEGPHLNPWMRTWIVLYVFAGGVAGALIQVSIRSLRRKGFAETSKKGPVS